MGGIYVKTRKGIHGIKPTTNNHYQGVFRVADYDFEVVIREHFGNYVYTFP